MILSVVFWGLCGADSGFVCDVWVLTFGGCEIRICLPGLCGC